MKKIFSLLLCLALLTGVLAVLSSCVKEEAKDTQLDVTGYRLIYAGEMKSFLLNPIEDMQGVLKRLTGQAPFMGRDKGTVEDYEILIGRVERPETAELLGKIKEDGYAFGVVNGKIVIVGTTELLTLQALWAFADTCLAGAENGVISVTETVVSNVEMRTVNTDYSVIYSAEWDDTANEGYKENPAWQGENPDAIDYGVVVARQIRQAMRNAIGAPTDAYELRTDAEEMSGGEVLVGLVDRAATGSFLKKLDVNDYGVAVIGNKLVVSGLNDTGLRAAVRLFIAFAEAAAEVSDTGERHILVPADFCWIESMNTSWKVDIPRPEGEGVDLVGSTPLGEGAFQFQYEGNGITEANYLAYCEKLVAEGYTLEQDQSAEGSMFRAYVHSDKYLRVYAIYAAYTHAAEQEVSVYPPCIRLITSNLLDSGNSFDGVLTPDYTYEGGKVTETKLTAVRLSYEDGDFGNCYVVQLEDGSFFIQDGGSANAKDYARLWRVLEDLYYRTCGKKPTADSPVVVAAWYLSHGHGDHYGNFVEMCKKNGSKIRAEYLIANMPSDEETYNCYDPNLTVRDNMSVISTYTKSPMTYLKVQTGQRLYLRNMEIEVLYTHGDIYPQTAERFNNTSTVLRTTLHSTDGKGNLVGEATTVLWLGDLQTRGSKCLRAMYGDYLKADIVQVAHHGGNGVELELYQLVAPRIVLWPCSVDNIRTRCKKVNATVGSAKYVSSNLYQKVDSVEYHVVSDLYNTTITITKDGPVMSPDGPNGLYNAGEDAEIVINEKISKYGYAVIKKK